MNNNILINYKPLNVAKSIFNILGGITLVVIVAYMFVFLLSNENKRSFYSTHWYYIIFLIIGIFLLILIQMFTKENIYIYSVTQQNRIIHIKWKKLNKHYEVSIPLNMLEVKLVPYGKNNPYLQISWNNKKNTIKQFFNTGWDRKTKQDFIEKINQLKKDNE